jgi:hypothetical protein
MFTPYDVRQKKPIPLRIQSRCHSSYQAAMPKRRIRERSKLALRISGFVVDTTVSAPLLIRYGFFSP